MNNNTKAIMNSVKQYLEMDGTRKQKSYRATVRTGLIIFQILSILVVGLVFLYGVANIVKYGLPAILVSRALLISIVGAPFYIMLMMVLNSRIQKKIELMDALEVSREDIALDQKAYAIVRLLQEQQKANQI